MLETQTPTWQSAMIQISAPVVTALGVLGATYLTQRHQRKLKAVEVDATARLRARELMFGVYEKRLAELLAAAAALGAALGDLRVAVIVNLGDDKKAEAGARFFSLAYSQYMLVPEFVEEIEADLTALGMAERFAGKLREVKNRGAVRPRPASELNDKEAMQALHDEMLKPLSDLIYVQRAILEARAYELFKDYLPGVAVNR